MQTLREGQRVQLKEPVGWWLADGLGLPPIVNLPVGAKGTLYKFQFNPLIPNTMYAIRFDDYPHPKEDGHCGLSGQDGSPLPKWLEYAKEEA